MAYIWYKTAAGDFIPMNPWAASQGEASWPPGVELAAKGVKAEE